jgi:hypothetical protein
MHNERVFFQAWDYYTARRGIITYKFKNGAPEWATKLLECVKFFQKRWFTIEDAKPGWDNDPVVRDAKRWYSEIYSGSYPVPFNFTEEIKPTCQEQAYLTSQQKSVPITTNRSESLDKVTAVYVCPKGHVTFEDVKGKMPLYQTCGAALW